MSVGVEGFSGRGFFSPGVAAARGFARVERLGTGGLLDAFEVECDFDGGFARGILFNRSL